MGEREADGLARGDFPDFDGLITSARGDEPALVENGDKTNWSRVRDLGGERS